jgi:hypothetical protein
MKAARYLTTGSFIMKLLNLSLRSSSVTAAKAGIAPAYEKKRVTLFLRQRLMLSIRVLLSCPIDAAKADL